MRNFFQKPIHWLSNEYYYKHFKIGLIFTVLNVIVSVTIWGSLFFDIQKNLDFSISVFIVISLIFHLAYCVANAYFYPFSVFIFDNIVKLLIGEGIFIASIFSILVWRFVKLMILFGLWFASIVLGPIAILYLYVQNSRKNDGSGPERVSS